MILILAPDCPEATLDSILKEAERLGWSCDVSRGHEQIAVGLSGDGDPRALEDALARRPEGAASRLLVGLLAGFGLLASQRPNTDRGQSRDGCCRGQSGDRTEGHKQKPSSHIQSFRRRP